MENIINIIVKDAENGKRIDSFISKKEKMLKVKMHHSVKFQMVVQV